MDGGDLLEELLGGDEVRQAGEELSHVDEVHAGEDVLVETQQAHRRAEQELFPVSAEHVPHPTRQVQRQRLTVQSEDPAGDRGNSKVAYFVIEVPTKHNRETFKIFLEEPRIRSVILFYFDYLICLTILFSVYKSII